MRAAYRLVLALMIPLLVARAEMTGRQVMDEQKKRHEVTSEKMAQIMLLVDRKGEKEQRSVRRYYKDLGKDETRQLVVFVEPATVRGTASLSWNHADRDDVQWLYMASQKKMVRIAKGGKKGYFMGTDITLEDMEGEDLDLFAYQKLESETVDGQDCFVVEAAPADKQVLRQSGYSKRKLWIRKDIFFPVKVEFYDHRQRHIKTLLNQELMNVEGTVWRARKSLMDNHKRNHKTLTMTKTVEINVPIDAALFSEQHILSEKHIQ